MCVRVCLVWMSPSVRVRTPGCPSPARTGQASLAREEGTLLLAGFNLELAGCSVPSQFYEIAWACTAAPVLNLVLLLNLACIHNRVQLYCTRVRTCNLVLVY